MSTLTFVSVRVGWLSWPASPRRGHGDVVARVMKDGCSDCDRHAGLVGHQSNTWGISVRFIAVAGEYRHQEVGLATFRVPGSRSTHLTLRHLGAPSISGNHTHASWGRNSAQQSHPLRGKTPSAASIGANRTIAHFVSCFSETACPMDGGECRSGRGGCQGRKKHIYQFFRPFFLPVGAPRLSRNLGQCRFHVTHRSALDISADLTVSICTLNT
jgi:hypothetical protein